MIYEPELSTIEIEKSTLMNRDTTAAVAADGVHAVVMGGSSGRSMNQTSPRASLATTAVGQYRQRCGVVTRGMSRGGPRAQHRYLRYLGHGNNGTTEGLEGLAVF